MSATASEVWAGIESVAEAAAVEISGTYDVPTIGTIDDNADEVLTPRRTHIVPVSDVYDTARGGGRCQRVVTFDIVVHYPRTPADIAKMLDDAEAFENQWRLLPSKLAALTPAVDAHEPHVVSGCDFGYSDVATATWRVSLRYRRA